MTPVQLTLAWLCVATLCAYRIYVEFGDRSRLPLAKRLVVGVIVALLLAAVLKAAEDDVFTDVMVRCHKCYRFFCCE